MKQTLIEYHESLFLSLLRAGLWGSAPQIPENEAQLREVLRLARMQSLLGIIGDEVLKCSRMGLEIPNSLRISLKSFKVSNAMASGNLNAAMKTVFSALAEAGMPPVLLKGAGLALNYPIPALRQCGDVDVLVDEKDYLRSYDVMRPLADRISAEDEIWIDKNYHLFLGDIEVEIHRHADEYPLRRKNRRLQEFAEGHLRRDSVWCTIGDAEVETPSDTFNAFYVFFHIFRHFMVRGVGLRQVCDWMLFLTGHRDGVDTDALKEVLEDLNLMTAWQDFGAVAVNFLGCPEDAIPFYRADVSHRRQEKVLKRILTEGNFGQDASSGRKRPSIYVVAKIHSLYCHVSRFVSLASLYPGHILPYMLTIFRFGFWGLGRDIRTKRHPA